MQQPEMSYVCVFAPAALRSVHKNLCVYYTYPFSAVRTVIARRGRRGVYPRNRMASKLRSINRAPVLMRRAHFLRTRHFRTILARTCIILCYSMIVFYENAGHRTSSPFCRGRTRRVRARTATRGIYRDIGVTRADTGYRVSVWRRRGRRTVIVVVVPTLSGGSA